MDRPAAAPLEGPYELKVMAVGSPGFVAGLTAAINLFGKPYMHESTGIILIDDSWIRVHSDLHAGYIRNEISEIIQKITFLIPGISGNLLYLICNCGLSVCDNHPRLSEIVLIFLGSAGNMSQVHRWAALGAQSKRLLMESLFLASL